MVFCSKCGYENINGHVFCVECGSNLLDYVNEDELNQYLLCFKCGRKNDDRSNFCVECGSKLTKSDKVEAKQYVTLKIKNSTNVEAVFLGVTLATFGFIIGAFIIGRLTAIIMHSWIGYILGGLLIAFFGYYYGYNKAIRQQRKEARKF